MAFITQDFLLKNEAARHLYHTYAKAQPILDFHGHLPVKDIAENRVFADLTEIWLEGDHYKWRAMRANGVPERYCTGDASSYEKFLAWAQTVPFTLRNPLYHWTHLELQRYFDVRELLNETSAERVWHIANELLMTEELSAQGILRKFGVVALCTTDDPADSLEYHEQISASGLETRVFPAFRPDRALRTDDCEAFNQWTDKLGASANVDITRFTDFLEALRRRHDDFHAHGCRLSDHGIDRCYPVSCGEQKASKIFAVLRAGKSLSVEESQNFAGFMMLYFGRLDAEKGWAKQLHLGAQRNANTRGLKQLGRDTGFDSIADWPHSDALVAYLDRLNQEDALPKMILYNVNPVDNYVLATVIGNYQDETVPGKLQFGSAWWFLDQKEGIEWQLNALSNCGLLSRFVGMLTDSRSFMSFPRHEYFRRVLCNLLGQEMEDGDLPDDEELIGNMVKNICFNNAASYLALPSISPRIEVPALATGDR
ncbi:MAG TPA: glucuronate isomerase [Terriglobales bacterium]|jgi:glucuronate isomerase